MIFAIFGGLADAYNTIAWEDAIPFTLIVIGLYWVKVKIDSTVGLGKNCLLYTSPSPRDDR